MRTKPRWREREREEREGSLGGYLGRGDSRHVGPDFCFLATINNVLSFVAKFRNLALKIRKMKRNTIFFLISRDSLIVFQNKNN